MSTALLEMEEVKNRYPVDSKPFPQSASDAVDPDAHPLVPVFIAGILAATFASMFVGSILVWLALRNSGVMAP